MQQIDQHGRLRHLLTLQDLPRDTLVGLLQKVFPEHR